MCVCSGTQSDSKPRSSSARASGAGCMESVVKNITAPIFMAGSLSLVPRVACFYPNRAARERNMPIASKYLFIVSMDVAKDKEALFNEVYDKEHVPLLSKVPGVRGVTRMKTEPAAFNIGGERKVLDGAGAPTYV